MEEMFSGAWAFRGDLSKWDVAQVRDFRYMFDHAYDFNSDLSSWTTSSAIHMDGMFSGTSSFDQDIGKWDVGNVESLKYVFEYAHKFNQDPSPWALSKVADFTSAFQAADAFSQVLCWVPQEYAVTDFMFTGSDGSLSSKCPTPSPTKEHTPAPIFSTEPTAPSPQPAVAVLHVSAQPDAPAAGQ